MPGHQSQSREQRGDDRTVAQLPAGQAFLEQHRGPCVVALITGHTPGLSERDDAYPACHPTPGAGPGSPRTAPWPAHSRPAPGATPQVLSERRCPTCRPAPGAGPGSPRTAPSPAHSRPARATMPRLLSELAMPRVSPSSRHRARLSSSSAVARTSRPAAWARTPAPFRAFARTAAAPTEAPALLPRQQPLQPAPSLAQIAPHVPEPPQCSRHPQAHLRCAPLSCAQRSAARRLSCSRSSRASHVACLRPRQVRLRLLGQRQEVGGMRRAQRALGPALRQALLGILADRLQHEEARLSPCGAPPGAAGSCPPATEPVEHVPGRPPARAHTSSAASSVQPPTNTLSQAKSVCSPGSSRL